MALLAAHEGEQHHTFCLLDNIIEYEPRRGENIMSDIAINAVQNTYVCKSRHTLLSYGLSHSLRIDTNVIVGASFNLPMNLEALQSPPNVYLDKSYPPTGTNRISGGTGDYFAIHFQYNTSASRMSRSSPESLFDNYDIYVEMAPGRSGFRSHPEQFLAIQDKWKKDVEWESHSKWELEINWNGDPANDGKVQFDEGSTREMLARMW